MMKYLYLFLSLFFMLPGYSIAELFLGAPIPPQGKTIQKTNSRLEFKTNLSHDEVVAFYRETLEEHKDIKFREWKDSTYIEDDGKLPWHSITISKGDEDGATVVIVKDNWTWIIGTLILRYIGVFIVLIVLLFGITISGAIISRLINKTGSEKQPEG